MCLGLLPVFECPLQVVMETLIGAGEVLLLSEDVALCPLAFLQLQLGGEKSGLHRQRITLHTHKHHTQTHKRFLNVKCVMPSVSQSLSKPYIS